MSGLSVFPTLPGLTFTSVKAPEFNTEVQAAPNRYEVRIQQTINPAWTWTLVFDFLHDYYWSGRFAVLSELRTLMGFFNQMGGKAGSFLYTDPDDNTVGPALTTAGWQANAYYPVGFSILVAGHWQQITTPGYSGSTAPTFSTSGGSVSEGPSSPQLTWKDQGSGYGSGAPNVPLAQLQLVTDGAGNWYSPVQRTLDGVFFEDITDLNGAIAVYANGVLASAGTSPGQYQLLGPGLALPGASYMGLYLKWGVAAAAWQASHAYALNALVLDPAGHVQKATTSGTSGATIPTFNDSGGTTEDPGFIVWTDKGNAAWAAGTYTLGQVIIDPAGHAQVVTTAGTTGGSIPTFNSTGGTTTDGSVVWTDKGNAAWAASTAYPTGSYIVDSGHAQKATAGGISGALTPTFSTSGGTANDPAGSVVWTDQGAYAGPTGPVTAQFSFYFRVRFDADSQDFEKFLGAGASAGQPPVGQGGGYWTIGGSESQQGQGTMRLTTARPTPL